MELPDLIDNSGSLAKAALAEVLRASHDTHGDASRAALH